MPADEILALIDAEMPLEPVEANYRGEVAGRYGTATATARWA